MHLIIDANLSCPPSELSSFRDVTLYAKIYNYESILIVAPEGTRSSYWNWMRKNAIKDYVSEIILPHECIDVKAIVIKEDASLPWHRMAFFSNGLKIKALHSYSTSIVLEYLRLIAE